MIYRMPTQSYNKTGNIKTLVGNWYEEDILQTRGTTNEYTTSNTASTTYNHYHNGNTTSKRSVGARQRLIEERLLQEAQYVPRNPKVPAYKSREEAAETIKPLKEPVFYHGPIDTTYRNDFSRTGPHGGSVSRMVDMEEGDYVHEEAITIYNHPGTLGTFHGVTSRVPRASFGKSTTFSTPIELYNKGQTKE